MRVTLFDYGAGNLHSLQKALARTGVELCVESDPVKAAETDALVLPGVGAFSAAAERLKPGREVMRDRILGGLPAFGICLGMQLLFDESEEGSGQGLGVIPGRVTRLDARRVPEIGWNAIEPVGASVVTRAELPIAYYAHSFACRPRDSSTVIAWTTHEGDRFPAAVRAGRATGVQFHPEKSSNAGLKLLAAWIDEVRR
jgi:glutamine amidotransferase